jgi:hypothetical protein
MTRTDRGRRVLVPSTEIERVIEAARQAGIAIAGLDVGRDYVRTIPPSQGGDSVAQYIGPTYRPQKAHGR